MDQAVSFTSAPRPHTLSQDRVAQNTKIEIGPTLFQGVCKGSDTPKSGIRALLGILEEHSPIAQDKASWRFKDRRGSLILTITIRAPLFGVPTLKVNLEPKKMSYHKGT